MSAHKPLEGVKVVELASFVAAPTAGRMMAEMGADVIRVESTAGDPWRFYGANCGLPITDEENPLFDIYNLGKKDIQLNTKTPEGKEILFHLLDEADVFITNNRLKSLVRSGLDYESLKDRFPKLIYGLVTGYGQTGPDVDAPGYDGVAFFSRSGMLADMAEPSGYPASAPGCIGDGATGAALFGGICAALFDRVRTGKGDFVEISLFGNAVWLCGTMSAFEQYGYHYPKKRSEMGALYTFYKCKDGEWLHLAVTQHDRYWKPLAEALNVPELATDPQAVANGFVKEYIYESGHPFMMSMPPVHMRSVGETGPGRGPKPGEHTDEILKQLGCSEDEIVHLKEAGAVKQHS